MQQEPKIVVQSLPRTAGLVSRWSQQNGSMSLLVLFHSCLDLYTHLQGQKVNCAICLRMSKHDRRASNDKNKYSKLQRTSIMLLEVVLS
jgi:hypothetical protein